MGRAGREVGLFLSDILFRTAGLSVRGWIGNFANLTFPLGGRPTREGVPLTAWSQLLCTRKLNERRNRTFHTAPLILSVRDSMAECSSIREPLSDLDVSRTRTRSANAVS